MSTKHSLGLKGSRLSELIAERLGLHFPPDRYADLQRGLATAAREFALPDADACADWLLATPLDEMQLRVLASHLTIGETYFFRERRTFDALAERVIPQLVAERRAEKRLRLWSAGCCTGEEPYSLAILLRQCLPDWQDWHVSILATDINERFLQKGVAGVYGEWSFREAQTGFKEKHFTRLPDGRHALMPAFKQWVKFAPLNLVEDSFPSLATDTSGMDVIFCRNVLMYFTPAQARKVASNLRRALRDDGWLVISAGDGSQALDQDFAPVNISGAILYRKKNQTGPALPAETQAPTAFALEPTEPRVLPQTIDSLLFSHESVSENLDATRQGSATRAPASQAAQGSQSALAYARALANEGKLDSALIACDQFIAENPVDETARYLRAVVLQELGRASEARLSLQQAVYLEPRFVLAFVALGNLARADGGHEQARRHFNHALELLRDCAPDELLPESDGLPAGRLAEMLDALLAIDAAA